MGTVPKQVGYVLFPNHTEALALYNRLKEAQIRCTLAPTPRTCSVCCGVSIRLEHPEDIPTVERWIQANGITIEQIVVL
ncbi:MAG: DUF3343 domain-containing protein [Oscillospiraceae bacterium]|nr:DUF3343 domain-containing protein [Oscillospiraceae bacterium]